MADTNPQTQTTVAPSNPTASPEQTATSASTASSLSASIEAAFANTKVTDKKEQTPQADALPAEAEVEEELELEDEVETEVQGEGEAEQEAEAPIEDETDPDGDPEELTTDSELPVPKWLDGLKPWQKKRVERYSRINRDLREQLAQKDVPQITITPTALNPLSDVQSVKDLDTRYAEAKRLKAWCEAHPDGEEVVKNGKTYEITQKEVAEKLARVTAEIEAYPDAKIELKEREQSRPWETAKQVLPDLFKVNSPDQQQAQYYLEQCPELAVRFTDHELVLAALVIGTRVVQDKLSGKAIHERIELGADGKPVLPKSSKPAAPVKPKAPVTPQGTKPPLRAGETRPRTRAEILASLPDHIRDDPEARLRALVDAA
jgi:hypothetical protein